MSLASAEQRVAAVLRRTPIASVVEPQRAVRFAEFLVVGATGAVLDIVVTVSALATTHYLLANALGFLVAVSWNFAGNWWLTFDQPDGRLGWQYASYVGLHAATFAIRAVVIALLVEATPTTVVVATVVGIGAAAVANFLASEAIFDGADRLWFDAVDAMNALAHRLYDSRLRRVLRASGLYGPLYRGYQLVLGLLYRADTHTVIAADGAASATVYTEHPAEVVSVMHTVEKEAAILDRFVDDLDPADRVWDVGANLGVFSALAADVVAGQVVAFEPLPANAVRARENLSLSGHVDAIVEPLALGDAVATVELAVERDEVGTQTPSTATAAETRAIVPVTQLPGDRFLAQTPGIRPPTVLKIDVEGAEGAVIRGLRDTLATHVRLVWVETHDGTFHEGGTAQIRERLTDLGFTVERVDAGSQTYFRGVRE